VDKSLAHEQAKLDNPKRLAGKWPVPNFILFNQKLAPLTFIAE
jgi:hypothetical protein